VAPDLHFTIVNFKRVFTIVLTAFSGSVIFQKILFCNFPNGNISIVGRDTDISKSTRTPDIVFLYLEKV